MITIIFLSLMIFSVKLEQLGEVCPDNKKPYDWCSAQEHCPNGDVPYRDVFRVVEDSKSMFGCCKSRCPLTDMPFGTDYDNVTESLVAYCSHANTTLYSYNHTTSSKTACCPKPFSDFLFGKKSGPLLYNFSLPVGWDFNGSNHSLKPCCIIDDCEKEQYCGKVRNPATMKLVERLENNCQNKMFSKNDNFLRFCYKYPSISYASLNISDHERDENFANLQLCLKNEDCFNHSSFCSVGNDSENLGLCVPIIGKLVHSIGAADAFFIEGGNCNSDEECDLLGLKWFSYQCERSEAPNGTVCVGYDILCSETALYQRGIHIDSQCGNDTGCPPSSDNSYAPQCVTDEFNGRAKVCCYEMKSCNFPYDLNPYGIAPMDQRMCSNDEQCQVRANTMHLQEQNHPVLWGRCIMELVSGWGKCCIANISTFCSVGRSILPPKRCKNHTECGWNPQGGNTQWCGDEGYCCDDFKKNDRSWLCPDQKTVRLFQPKCESGDGKLCNEGAGYCLLDRCCPMVTIMNEQVVVWAETPWYYNNHTCSDTNDLPADMDMVYCHPKRKIVTRTTRGDWFSVPIMAINVYCTSNNNCTDISSSLVCLKEFQGIQRCHTYYDRRLQWWLFILPTAMLGLFSFMFIFHWRHDLKKDWNDQRDTIR